MTQASIETFRRRRGAGRISRQAVIDYMREVRETTIHDAVDALAARIQLPENESRQESGQFWAELVSRFGEAARKGYLDDSTTVKSEIGSIRTLYRYLEVKGPERLSNPDKLRARIKELEEQLAELTSKYEVACATIDRGRQP